MLTLISHFYNEEYLLPWWLEHHKKMAKFGVMIDYHSTDRSVDIIKSICPNWQIITSKNETFGAAECDREVQEVERTIKGYKMALNTTEFLIGNVPMALRHTPKYLSVKSFIMCDLKNNLPSYPNYDRPLIEQCHTGMVHHHYRPGRTLHRFDALDYTKGRHTYMYDTELLALCWFGWAPFNEHTLKRKLQIQNKIPPEQFATGAGVQHKCTVEDLMAQFDYLSSTSYDLAPFINAIHNYGK